MFKKITLGALAAFTALSATPVAVQAATADGYYRDGSYSEYDRGDRYSRNDRYGRYDRYDRNDRYDRRNARRYEGRYARNRCDNGNGGTIIGAIAGGLLGHEVAGRNGDKTMGAIIGGAAGALAGRAIDKNSGDGRRC